MEKGQYFYGVAGSMLEQPTVTPATGRKDRVWNVYQALSDDWRNDFRVVNKRKMTEAGAKRRVKKLNSQEQKCQ